MRGLKLPDIVGGPKPVTSSHPTGVRGLKHHKQAKEALTQESHPTGVRGLKQMVMTIVSTYYGVAPHGGAWIETR